MSKLYKSWRDFPMAEWRWPNFSPQELASKGEGELMIDAASMDKLQKLRNLLGKPLIITSAYRSLAHNRKIKSKDTSQHRLAKAYDIVMTNHDPTSFEAAARSVGFTGFGHYPKSNFMHIDTGPARRWSEGGWFPKTNAATPNFQAEPKGETILDVIKKPEVMAPIGMAIGSGAAVTQGSGPVQWAIGLVLVAAVAFIMWRVTRPKEV